MTESNRHSGGCQCGRVRYQIHGQAEMLYVCHCTDCQKQSSSAFGMSLIIKPVQLEFVHGEALLNFWQTEGEAGGIKRCAFCRHCGSRIYHAGNDPQDSISIKAGSLDQRRGLEPVAHIWIASAQAWSLPDPDQVPCFEKGPENLAELVRQWQHKNTLQ